MKKFLLFLLTILLPLAASAFTGQVVIGGIKYSIDTDSQTAKVVSNNYSGDIVIPETVEYDGVVCNVTSIDFQAFSGCNELTSIQIPKSVTIIDQQAFEECTALTSVLIPGNVTTIGYMAFSGCTSLSSLTISNGVKSIGSYAFAKCGSLKSVTIPGSVSEIGSDAFSGCSSLFSLVIEEGVGTIGSYAFYGCSSLTSVDIPNSVTSIESYTFYGCTSLASLSIGSGVTSIGSYAFNECSALNSVLIPGSVTTIGNNAFEGCASLSSLTISNGVKSIDSYAFAKCGSLKSVTIPGSVSEIGSDAFEYCSGLTSLVIEEGIGTIESFVFYGCSSLTSVDIPNSVTSIESYAFKGCTSLGSLSIGSGVTSIGSYAFNECSALTSVLIPDSVAIIESSAFSGCSGLTTIIIGNGISSINNYVFESCENLTKVFCYAENVPSTNSDVFYNSGISNATLYLLEGSIDAYKASEPWSGFKEFLPVPKVTYMVDDEIYKEEIVMVTLPFTPIAEPEKEGYTFSGWQGVPETMPMNDVIIKGYFTINTYILTYMVDNKVYKQYEVVYNTAIEPEAEPEKEGHTFSGWSEIPEKMPARDVTVTGEFIINSYMLTYMVDGEVYKQYEVVYASTIEPEAEPVKEGHTFSGWSEIPETMPARDVTVTGEFTINSYKLTYMVDDEVYKQYEIVYGTAIEPEAELTKEGYTFSGWSEIPETMPGHDVTVKGSFTINTYKLKYVLNNKEYKTYDVEYGAAITPEPDPVKEHYTFSGWSYIPSTMPAEDVTVTGSLVPNKYTLTYYVDNEVYKSYEIAYEDEIVPEVEPVKEGYTFSGWGYIPSKMPAEDVNIYGTFTINSYKLTYMIDDKVYKETLYKFGATITPEPTPQGDYATFEWVDLPETMPAHDVVVNARYTTGIIEMLMSQEKDVKIYSPNGKMLDKPQKGLNIIKMSDGRTQKVVIR